MFRARRTDNSEIFVETVTNEDTSKIDEETQFLVCDLQRHERVSREEWVEITSYGTSWSALTLLTVRTAQSLRSERQIWQLTSDTRKLSQIVDDSLARVDVVIDEGDTSVGTFTAQD